MARIWLPRPPRWHRLVAVLAGSLLGAGAAAAGDRPPGLPQVGPALSGLPPGSLDPQDVTRYRQIFVLQDAGRIAEANTLVAGLKDPRLMGHVLAQRYLAPATPGAGYARLVAWLRAYADLPEAAAVYRLALARRPAGAALPPPPVAGFLGGAGQELRVPGTMAELGLLGRWQAGLAAWRRSGFGGAADVFARIAAAPGLKGEALATASFWAARASLRAGRTNPVQDLLRRAAAASDEFYGLIAQRLLQHELAFDWRPERLDAALLALVLKHDAARRAIALARVGAVELADAEVRKLAGRVGPGELEALTALAQRLGLPAAQMRLAQALRLLDGRRHDGAMFPIPAWQPATGLAVDRALLLAIVRAESAFDAAAVSPAGARGLMQIMPGTERLARVGLGPGRIARNLFEPAANLAVGQAWLLHLAGRPIVGGDLIRLLVAYNAGEGRLAGWLEGDLADAAGDPLFLIERIPLAQTRVYVKKVLGNLWAYQARLGEPAPALQALAWNRAPAFEPLSTPPLNGSTADAGTNRP